MAIWKKIITSGSDAELNNITASGAISASGVISGSEFYGDGSNLTDITANAFTTINVPDGANAVAETDSDIVYFTSESGAGLNISGSSDDYIKFELDNIPNSSLENISITIGNSTIELGDSSTELEGLTKLDMTLGNKAIFTTIGNNTLTLGASDTTIAIAGDLDVNGTVTTIDSTNILISESFAAFCSGSQNEVDGGFVIQNTSMGAEMGYGFGWDAGTHRWVSQISMSHESNGIDPDAFVCMYTTSIEEGIYAKPGNISIVNNEIYICMGD